MEFEFYDRDYLESERADIWRVEARATGLLFAALAQRLGIAVDSADYFPDALARAFASWTAFTAWLLEGSWPVRHHRTHGRSGGSQVTCVFCGQVRGVGALSEAKSLLHP